MKNRRMFEIDDSLREILTADYYGDVEYEECVSSYFLDRYTTVVEVFDLWFYFDENHKEVERLEDAKYVLIRAY